MPKENTTAGFEAMTPSLMLEFNIVQGLFIVLLPNGKYLPFVLLGYIHEKEKKAKLR